VNKSGQRGTAAETAVVRALIRLGVAGAERRRLRGRDDAGDITGWPGVAVSVKGGDKAKKASDGLIEQWLAELETQRRNANAEIGLLTVQRKGVGYPNAEQWHAYLHLDDIRRNIVGLANVTAWVSVHRAPVRMQLQHAVRFLQAMGW
jgi:hypothetical protein